MRGSNGRPLGAIEEFDSVRFGGPTRSEETYVVIDSTNDIVVGANPDRVLLLIQNNGTDTLYWSTKPNRTQVQSFSLGSTQQLVFQVQDDGALTGAQIYGQPNLGTCNVTVMEVIRDHPA